MNNMDYYHTIKQIIDDLYDKGLTLGTVESATGGLISSMITGVPGSSSVYQGSVISYSNRIKSGIIDVKESSLEKYGAVSATVARQMASNGRKILGVDICISDSGIAGPGGSTSEKPEGLFYFGISTPEYTKSYKKVFQGDRNQKRHDAAVYALEILRKYLGIPR